MLVRSLYDHLYVDLFSSPILLLVRLVFHLSLLGYPLRALNWIHPGIPMEFPLRVLNAVNIFLSIPAFLWVHTWAARLPQPRFLRVFSHLILSFYASVIL